MKTALIAILSFLAGAIAATIKKTDMKPEQLDEWWSGLTITQKERIAGKVVSAKAGKVLTCFYPNCTNVWNSISDAEKQQIHEHCTDTHGLVLEEYQEKHSMSY